MPRFDRIAEVDITDTIGGKALSITKLSMRFKVDRTHLSEPDSCVLEIRNLSQETRDKINKVGSMLQLKVGYVDEGLLTIFYGDITEFDHQYSAPDWVTTIRCMDGQNILTTSRISIVFKEFTNVIDMIETIIKRVGWTRNNEIESLPGINNLELSDLELSGGYMANDLVRNILDYLCGKINVQWTIQDNAITFSTLDGSTNEKIVAVSKETGMIGVPQRASKYSNNVNKKKSNKRRNRKQIVEGYVTKCLLQPLLKPGSKVHLISDKLELNSVYKIGEVYHAGDTHGNMWETRFKALLSQDTKVVGA